MRPVSLALVLALGGATALSACGRVGTLEQPAPLYGAKAKADYRQKKAAEAARAQAAKESGEPEPLPSDTPPPDGLTSGAPHPQ
jgi:hypothetical protein